MKSNPWIGLASYDEKDLDLGYKFVGRSTEISQLFSLIDDNLLVTIYGKSGIGKSSLLNAGIFPVLRAADYLPVVCRCDLSDYPDFIVDQIKSLCNLKSHKEVSKYPNLVDFFRNCEFINEGGMVFPVLVFDQFEDWFRINPPASVRLLKDIAFLTSEHYEKVTNYRFVISIREDYLYLLEDAIDNINKAELKQNRFRLTELRKPQADEILDLGNITDPVRNRILKLTKENVGYNPGLISLFCSELFQLYPSKITEDALMYLGTGSSLIETYYNRCFNNQSISSSTKKYIESHLQEEGVRHPQNIETVSRNIPEEELNILLKGNNKLLRKYPVGNVEHIELLHDSLAKIIHNRMLKQLDLQRNRNIMLALSIYFLPLIFIAWHFLDSILYTSWGILNSDNVKDYIFSIFAESGSYIDTSTIHIEYAKTLMYSKIGALIALFCMSVFKLPKDVCDYFYNKLTVRYIIGELLLIVVLWFLSSTVVLKSSITHNKIAIFVILSWLISLILYIWLIIQTFTTNKTNEK